MFDFHLSLYLFRLICVTSGVLAHLSGQNNFDMWLFFGKMLGFELFLETGYRVYLRWIK